MPLCFNVFAFVCKLIHYVVKTRILRTKCYEYFFIDIYQHPLLLFSIMRAYGVSNMLESDVYSLMFFSAYPDVTDGVGENTKKVPIRVISGQALSAL